MTRAPMKIVYEPPLRTIMVAGGAGFAGKALCDLLRTDGALRVISVDAYPGASIPPETGNFRAVALRPGAADPLIALLREERVDTVVDLDSGNDGLATGFASYLADAEHWHRDRLRFVSVGPTGPASRPAHCQDVPLVSAQAASLYGPGQSADALIPRTIQAALAGMPVLVESAGINQCDWLHVDDHSRALLTLLTRGQVGATYQIGARETRSALSTIALICDLIDRITPRPDGRKHRSLIRFSGKPVPVERREPMNPLRLEQELGWHAETDLHDGLMHLIDWHLSRERSRRAALPEIEVFAGQTR